MFNFKSQSLMFFFEFRIFFRADGDRPKIADQGCLVGPNHLDVQVSSQSVGLKRIIIHHSKYDLGLIFKTNLVIKNGGGSHSMIVIFKGTCGLKPNKR